MSNLDKAVEDFKKADKRYSKAKIAFVVFLVGFFIYISIQLYALQSAIARNQTLNAQASKDRFTAYTLDNQKQHEKTQKYVRCIAESLLLKPIDQRPSDAFDQCSKEQ